jgi:DNA-binding MarR family transcriptional regulator
MNAQLKSHAFRRRNRNKGRRTSGTFMQIQHYILKSKEFGALTPYAVKLLLELAKEYNGTNNGDFSAAYSVLKKRGWNSPGTLSETLKELRRAGWIVVTRQGGRNRCSLFAVTWWPIDGCNGKIDYMAESVARNDWRKSESVVDMSTNVVTQRSN